MNKPKTISQTAAIILDRPLVDHVDVTPSASDATDVAYYTLSRTGRRVLVKRKAKL